MLLRRHVRLRGFVVLVHHQSNLDSAQNPNFRNSLGRTKKFERKDESIYFASWFIQNNGKVITTFVWRGFILTLSLQRA